MQSEQRVIQELQKQWLNNGDRIGDISDDNVMGMKTDAGKFSSGLTKAEIERLALLMEEAAEIQQVIGKILRHGYGSYNPFDPKKTPNRELLNKELGDFEFALALMGEYADVNSRSISKHATEKRESIQKYLHFNQAKRLKL